MSRNAFDSYSTTTNSPLIGERSNIVSSTLIEDVPHRTDNQFNRFNLPHENGQHAPSSPIYSDDIVRDTASNYPDEASSSQSREKPTNPFAISNDSSVVNFSAHLQRAKSLFTNRSYVSPRLKNYRMRNPRSSLYRSTSSLCDNNSVSSNASSAMSSPFYNGQTTFGGASATSRRANTPLNQEQLLHHRPKIPTNLVTSRSTSSLNSIASGSTSMSTTAKRILDVMSKYNTPLTEVRRISNALPSIAETSALNKRKSILELDASTNEIDKTKRMLVKPNTPYNRPFGRNPVESVLTTELHVPSMPELLQLKKFAANTMKIRDIASNSDSVLNKPHPGQANEFKLSKTTALSRADSDLDTSNNNKSVNNKNNAIPIRNANDATKQDKFKIRSNLNKRKVGKCSDGDSMPEAVNLPNIPLVMDKKAEIKFSKPFKLQDFEQKTVGEGSENGLQIPFKFKSSNVGASIAASAAKEKRTNGNDSDASKKFEINPSKAAAASSLSTQSTTFNFNARSEHTVDSPVKPLQPALNCSKPSTNFRFTEPIVLNSTSKSIESQHNSFDRKYDYKFSEPTFVHDKPDEFTKTEANKSLTNFRFDPKPIKGVTSDSGIAETTQSFESNASKTSSLIASKPTVSITKDNGFSAGKTVSSASTQLKDDDTFKSIGAKQNKPAESQPAAEKPVIDDVFKAIVSKQKSNWECSACCTQNDVSKLKCACCEQPKDGVPKAAPKPVVDDIFKSIVNKQKSSWECSACMAQNDASKSKCVCCEQSRDVTASATNSGNAAPAKSQFSFGNNSTTVLPKSTFSFGSNPSTAAAPVASGFSFGNLPAAKTNPSAQFVFGNLKSSESTAATTNTGSTDTEKAKESVQKPAPSSAQISFGNSTVLPSTSNADTASKPAAPIASVAPDDVFKSIVNKQKSASWQCDACLTSNSNNVEKCMCCESPKPGTAPKDGEKKEIGLPASSKFSFGSQGSSTFSFGSKPDNKPSFQFGNLASSSSATGTGITTTAAAVATKTTVSIATIPVAASTHAVATTTTSASTTVPAIFGGSSQTPAFSFTTPKPVTEPSTTSQAATLKGFQFSFGSPSAPAPTFGCNEISKDVTDTGPTSSTSKKSVNILENVLIKPATTNGPTEAPKPLFGFGQPASNDDQPSKAKKRPNADQFDDNILAKTPATGSAAPFIFGQPQNVNNTFSATASSPATNVSQESSKAQATQMPTFAFGTGKPAISSFPTVQPSFSSTPFSFNASSPATTTAPITFGATAAAAPASNTPSQPIFGSNAFSSNAAALPALGGLKAGAAFGSSTPVFGVPSPNTEVIFS